VKRLNIQREESRGGRREIDNNRTGERHRRWRVLNVMLTLVEMLRAWLHCSLTLGCVCACVCVGMSVCMCAGVCGTCKEEGAPVCLAA
jgi:hypothetical protein